VTIAISADPFDALVLDFYERTASQYDTWAGGTNVRAAARLAELAAVQTHERAIDIGAGTGVATHALRGDVEAGGCSVGVDYSLRMISVAEAHRTAGSKAQFLHMDARRLYFHDASFEVALLGQLLAYLSNPLAVLEETRRLLRPGGRVVISCQCRSLCTPAQALFFERLDGLALRVPRGPEHHSLLGEPWVITEMLQDAGFDDISTTQMVMGNRVPDATAWVDLMSQAGPWPDAVLRFLTPAARRTFEEKLDEGMRRLGERAYSFHGAFTFAVAFRG
jgi:SAM-dependent methyltransferase